MPVFQAPIAKCQNAIFKSHLKLCKPSIYDDGKNENRTRMRNSERYEVNSFHENIFLKEGKRGITVICKSTRYNNIRKKSEKINGNKLQGLSINHIFAPILVPTSRLEI